MPPLVITPVELVSHVRQIVAETCRCEITFDQHAGPLTANEIVELRVRFNDLLMRLAPERLATTGR